MKGKKVIALLLALVLCFAMAPAAWAAPALGNFTKVNTYTAGQFRDVAAKAWYEESVKAAYELGLMDGVGKGKFDPNGQLSIAQSLAMACRLHSIFYNGTARFTQGTPWYQVYVDYAVDNGLVKKDQFSDYGATATRAEFAGILAAALPVGALTAINEISDGDLPDVSMKDKYGPQIYLLYRAGVLTGSDEAGTFEPRAGIQRSAVSAIVARMAREDLRKTLELKSGYTIRVTPDSCDLTVGVSTDLTVVFKPAGQKAELTWTSSNEKVATVKDGKVTAVGPGKATMTCTAENGAKDTCEIAVKDDFDPDVTFTTFDLEGNTWTEELFRDNELTMINFWEYWCGPCISEMPDLQKLYEDYADQGLQIVGVFTDVSSIEAVLYQVEATGVRYPILFNTYELSALQSDYVPTTVFVDSQGHIVGETVIGSMRYEDWVEIIEDLL